MFASAPKIYVELPFNDPAHFAQADRHFGGLGIFKLGRVTSVGRPSSTMPRFAPETRVSDRCCSAPRFLDCCQHILYAAAPSITVYIITL
jgi:hypothetical protein